MEKKYFILENIALWGGILLTTLYGIFLQIIVFELQKCTYNVTYIVIMMCFVGLYVTFLRYLKNMGFGKTIIKPHIYITKLRYSTILDTFNKSFSKVHILDDKSAYILEKKYGLKLRINIMEFDSFSKDILKQRKKYINRVINRKHTIKNNSNLSNSYNKVRINLIVVKNFDAYCKEIVCCNATKLFSRIECVLNIVFLEKNGEIFIPAHFGINKIVEYYKTLKLIKKVLVLENASIQDTGHRTRGRFCCLGQGGLRQIRRLTGISKGIVEKL